MRSRIADGPRGLWRLLPLLAIAAALAAAVAWPPAPAVADPAFEGLILPGLDPLLRGTTDERLLGPERLTIRRRLLAQGRDPARGFQRPTLESLWRARLESTARINLGREVVLTEIDGFRGLASTITYPEWFLFFPGAQPLPGGFTYYPPRPVAEPDVDLFVDSLADAEARRLAVARKTSRATLLDVTRRAKTSEGGEGLLNLTIPIKLPRTLEKIIGRGEKTSIRISGRERISISGESTVTNKFVPNERVQSQSLFPTLDMEQELQLNLSGQIGEKIQIEVDHNSQIVGPEGTKIRLAYRGNEDEVIQSIETGDVGLTLPGSQLLGYASNKSGLFGVKATGRVGRLDFTVVASKQKAESAAKSFNSRGGEMAEHRVLAGDYLANRFFRLDLPPGGPGQLVFDNPGRPTEYRIDMSSIRIYRRSERTRPTGPSDFQFIAAFVDTTGLWEAGGQVIGEDLEIENPAVADIWEKVEDWQMVLDEAGRVIAIDLGRSYDKDDVLAVYYEVVDAADQVIYRVGDKPGAPEDLDNRIIINNNPDKLYTRLKLLKPAWSQATRHTWDYMLRNIYSLGGSNIDRESFDLRIETTDIGQANPHLVKGTSVPWIRVFGLDRYNAQRELGSDDLVDKQEEFLFDWGKGLLVFPLDFAHPFAAEQAIYFDNAPELEGVWDQNSLLFRPQIYERLTQPSDYQSLSSFQIVAKHASASSSFNLGTMNIEEGSETVTLDGRTLARGADYDIDYVFGEIKLLGEAAASLTSTSQVGVNYQYAPFMGGGRSSLLGLNLGYDLGSQSKLSTTWLFQSEQISGHKAKLGEEPSRNLVGNLNLQHTLKPWFLTDVANFLARRDSERESTLQVNAEAAASVPDPNTRDKVYLEDFEGVDAGTLLPMNRLGWYWASAPAQGQDPAYIAATGDGRNFVPAGRVPVVRWYTPKDPIPRRFLNPELVEQERKENQQALGIYMRAGPEGWQQESWGGIMRGLGRVGVDLSKSQFLEFWVNDFAPDAGRRRGRLHLDFGAISEDFHWARLEGGALQLGVEDQEDANGDNIFTGEEDVGLDNATGGDDVYGAEFGSYEDPFPRINGTEGNQREDGEDLDGDQFETANGYYSLTIDLAQTEPLVDVVHDYAGEDVEEMIRAGVSWRKYRIPLGDVVPVRPPGGGQAADIRAVTHVRIWYEDLAAARDTVQLQLSDFEFVGSRWERDGVRRLSDEVLLTEQDRVLYPDERYYLGEVNNKENPDYVPPFSVHEENRIAEKEQSLVMDVQNLEPGHTARATRQVSPRGDDYTLYERMSWFWHSPDHRLADVDLFFRLGADTANYYEVGYRYSQSTGERSGWKRMQIDLAVLSNVKIDERETVSGRIEGTVPDTETGELYRVRVVGQPDLRRVRRYWFGVANGTAAPVTGVFYLNDVILDGALRERGLAERIALRLNMADVLKVDFDWSQQDAEFHGLNADRGRGFADEDWNLSTSFRVDDFVPLLGFRLPVTLGRRQTVQRPKYFTNSDIELIDRDERNRQSTVEDRETFSVRLMHEPSAGAILRYVVDPWSFSLNGTRGRREAPLEQAHQKDLQGSVTYDLRIAGDHTLGDYPVLRALPVLRGLSLVPSKVTLSSSFASSERTGTTRDLEGLVSQRPVNLSRTGNLSGQFEYRPLPLLTIDANLRSERDLLREKIVGGVNIGQENRFTQDMRLTISPPRAQMLPAHPWLAPARLLLKGINDLQPSISFNGSFSDDHGPAVRRIDDPPSVRNVSSSGDWQVRFRVPIGDWAEEIFPRGGESEEERQRMIQQEQEQQRRDKYQGRRPEPGARAPLPGAQAPTPGAGGSGTQDAFDQAASGSGAPEGQFAPAGQDTLPGAPGPGTGPVDEDLLSAEERRRQEEAALLEAARRRAEEERRRAQPTGEEAGAAAGAGAPADSAAAADEGGGFRVPNPLAPVLSLLRGTSPVQVTLTQRRAGAYQRLLTEAPFWYKTGLEPVLSLSDSLYVTSSLADRDAIQLSTDFRLTSKINLTAAFNETKGSQEQAGRVSNSYQRDWPDLRLSVGGLEKWGIFGGGEDREGWFSSSNVDLSFKKSLSVANFTPSNYDPRTTTSINPRWSINFRNGFSAALNVGYNRDIGMSGGVRTTGTRWNAGLQLRQSIKAERLLARLGLYKPGQPPTINMDVDISYGQDSTERLRPGQVAPDVATGSTRMGVNPRFSYQINRNLSGALRFTYSRSKTLETDMVRQSFGLGLEATLVF